MNVLDLLYHSIDPGYSPADKHISVPIKSINDLWDFDFRESSSPVRANVPVVRVSKASLEKIFDFKYQEKTENPLERCKKDYQSLRWIAHTQQLYIVKFLKKLPPKVGGWLKQDYVKTMEELIKNDKKATMEQEKKPPELPKVEPKIPDLPTISPKIPDLPKVSSRIPDLPKKIPQKTVKFQLPEKTVDKPAAKQSSDVKIETVPIDE